MFHFMILPAEKALLDDESNKGIRAMRRKRSTAALLPGLPVDKPRKPRKKLSPEELAERKKKVYMRCFTS